MVVEIGINLSEFQSSVDALRTSSSNLVSSIQKNRTFDKTNIQPFTKDLENVIRAVDLLQQYKSLLESDINTLEHTGENIRENDEGLAQANTNVLDGPQKIHL